MKIASVPEDETRRLRALRNLNLLDTPQEERFDRITRVAADLFEVPIAAITLIDADRQWSKSCVGLTVRESPRAVSFCAHAILGATTMVVPDALLDERFADSPVVTGPPHLRFYAGHPIAAPSGERLGTLCLVDMVPRVLDDRQLSRLRDLAGWVEEEIGREDERAMVDQLRDSEKRVWTLMDSIAEGIVAFSDDGLIRQVNRSAEQSLGYEPGELLGLPIGILLRDHETGRIVETVTPAAPANGGGDGTKLGLRQLVTGVRKDGSTFPMEVVVTEARISTGRFLVAIAQDVTERMAAEAAMRTSERRFRTIFDGAADGMALIDLRGPTFVEVNGALGTMLGHDLEALRGAPFNQIVPGGEHADVDDKVQAWLDGGGQGSLRRNMLLRRADDSTMWAELSMSMLRDDDDDETTLVMAIIEDVTERLETEQIKDEFISVVGHELRTPLTAIRGSLGLLSGGVFGALPDEADEMVAMAIVNTDRLVRLVNDMLDIEKMDAGHLELERGPVGTNALLQASLDAVQALADEAGVHVEISGTDVTVDADPDRIIQTLVNLLGNAVKFSPRNGVVTVEVTRLEDHAEFAVRDHGRGIPLDQLDTIFERFRQVDATDAREKGGTGLGLAIAQRIVEWHGGRIWAESPDATGCTMRFTLPLATGVRLDHEDAEL